VWKVLRDTEGERFVIIIKATVFKENLQVEKKEFYAKGSV
jgi:hypothetical protein